MASRTSFAAAPMGRCQAIHQQCHQASDSVGQRLATIGSCTVMHGKPCKRRGCRPPAGPSTRPVELHHRPASALDQAHVHDESRRQGDGPLGQQPAAHRDGPLGQLTSTGPQAPPGGTGVAGRALPAEDRGPLPATRGRVPRNWAGRGGTPPDTVSCASAHPQADCHTQPPAGTRARPSWPEYTPCIEWSEGSGMLTCYGDEVRLPQNDLAYVGFRLAVLDTLCQMDICHGSGDEDISGYLAEVPVLEQVAPAVQVDLLAEAWRRHQAPELHEASLLDAAVVYAAFCTAGRVVNDEFEVATAWLKAGPRRVRCRLSGRTSERLHDLFFEFWDDEDFLSLSALQDLPPEHAGRV